MTPKGTEPVKPAWTIESVELRHPHQRNPFEEPSGIPPDVIRAIARGRMADGRPFYHEHWITQEFYDDAGEEVAIQMVRDSARPPAEKEGA